MGFFFFFFPSSSSSCWWGHKEPLLPRSKARDNSLLLKVYSHLVLGTVALSRLTPC
jgi:hypothetical protein